MNTKIIKRAMAVLICLSMALPVVSFAVNIKTTVTNDVLSKKKQSTSNKYLTAAQAYSIVKSNEGEVLFIDVRTRAEIEFVGWTPLVDAVIPYMTNDFDEWNKEKHRYLKVLNGEFPIALVDLVAAKGMDKNTPIIFMCRSGSRSSKAASLATKLGFTNAYSMVDGFEGDKAKTGDHKGHRVLNGWKNSDAPWDYSVDNSKVMFNQ